MDKQISKIKFYSFIFGLILILEVVGTVLFFRNSNLILSTSLFKIDSLITEIGQLKDQNQLLKEQIESETKNNQDNQSSLEKIYQDISDQLKKKVEKQQNLEEYQQFLQQEINNQKSDLTNQLNQKDQQIVTLQEKQKVSDQFIKIASQLNSTLFLGDNEGLTDTIILVIVNQQNQKITLLSIPRDLSFEGRKINEYLHSYGIEKTKDIVKQITGIKPDKYVKLNFKAFADVIDSLNGVDIQIDKEIIDKSYPTKDHGYKVVTFEPGLEKMYGARALEYARSRKSTNDFDRSLRQQKIIIALKEKLKSFNVMKNLDFLTASYQNIQSNLETDYNVLEAIQSFDKYKYYTLSAGNILSNQNFLYDSKSLTGQYILIPKKHSFINFQEKLLEII